MPNLSDNFIDNFKKAENTFKYQIVSHPVVLVPDMCYKNDVVEGENLNYDGMLV